MFTLLYIVTLLGICSVFVHLQFLIRSIKSRGLQTTLLILVTIGALVTAYFSALFISRLEIKAKLSETHIVNESSEEFQHSSNLGLIPYDEVYQAQHEVTCPVNCPNVH